MGSNVGSRMKTGQVLGTGAEIAVSVPEFTPRRVELFNPTALVQLVHTNQMPAASGLKTLQGAPPVISYPLVGGVTLVEQLELDDGVTPGRGFLIGTDADVNAVGENIFFTVFE